MHRGLRYIVILALLATSASNAASGNFPELEIPNNYGVNIHRLNDIGKEMEAIEKTGFRIVRTDMNWASVEKTKGKFDWSDYDNIAQAAKENGIRVIFILDYSNNIYEPQIEYKDEKARSQKNIAAPAHPESITAYANFARAAAQHFQAYDPIWEIWNEPEWAMFWAPQSNVQAYTALAKESCSAIRSVVPGATIIGPAAAKVPSSSTPAPAFLATLLASKIGDCLSAISVHPYLTVAKLDTAPSMWRQLRDLVAATPVLGTPPQLVSSEWGLTTVGNRVTPQTQASYLVRMMLLNQADGIPVSIWYDWRDDGESDDDPENRFGVVDTQGKPKPAQMAMRNLSLTLNGYAFLCRRDAAKTAQLVFKDMRSGARKLAVWSINTGPLAWIASPSDELRLSFVDFPNPSAVTDMLGDPVSVTKSGNDFWILKGGLQPFFLDLKPGAGPCARASME